MLDYGVISDILKDIAIRHNVNPNHRINTYARIYDEKDFNKANFGLHAANAIKSGSYWVRGGIKPDQDCKRYGALFLMKRSSYRDINGENCMQLSIGVALQLDCTDCPEKDMIRVEKEFLAEQVLHGVIEQLKLYNLYMTDDGGHVWATQKMIECYDISTNGNVCDNIGMNISNSDRIDIYCKYNATENIIIQSAPITICGCAKVDQKFDDCATDDASLPAIIKCKTCF